VRGGTAPTLFLTSALEGGEWSASRPGSALPPGERAPGTHCTRGWVGPRAGLDAEVSELGKRCPCVRTPESAGCQGNGSWTSCVGRWGRVRYRTHTKGSDTYTLTQNMLIAIAKYTKFQWAWTFLQNFSKFRYVYNTIAKDPNLTVSSPISKLDLRRPPLPSNPSLSSSYAVYVLQKLVIWAHFEILYLIVPKNVKIKTQSLGYNFSVAFMGVKLGLSS
jgi:hypothetical protein